MWLAGASLLAIALGLGDANADQFCGPKRRRIAIPLTGYYDFKVAGADGEEMETDPWRSWRRCGGELFLDAGGTLDLVLGGGGGAEPMHLSTYGGGGGGGSFVFLGSSYLGGGLLFAAAGGDGQCFF